MTSTAIAVKDLAKEEWDANKTMRIGMDRLCARQKRSEFTGSTRKSAGHDAGDANARSIDLELNAEVVNAGEEPPAPKERIRVPLENIEFFMERERRPFRSSVSWLDENREDQGERTERLDKMESLMLQLAKWHEESEDLIEQHQAMLLQEFNEKGYVEVEFQEECVLDPRLEGLWSDDVDDTLWNYDDDDEDVANSHTDVDVDGDGDGEEEEESAD
uniref:Uncharacterized protein n=1 Tax=Oryza brachyantha TaxID=4533 RepID=J3N8P7_ORYBR